MKNCLFLLGILFLFNPQINAEPWVSQRFAQNCAGCHAPGRLNKPAKGRRCTLSCQGCHVSPQGGGLRNNYGMWNQQRWLASLKNKKTFGHKGAPVPHNKQSYIKTKPNKKGKYPVKKITTTNKLDLNEAKYGNKAYTDWKRPAKNTKHFLSRVPHDDPFRLERNFQSSVGGDLRFMYLSGDIHGISDNSVLFPMTLDLGVRIRPTRENYSFVVETRFANGPTKTELEDLVEQGAYIRSAYFLADDLAYNSYIMAGIFRPMFGNYNPDHYSLSNQLTGLGNKAVFKGVSIGTAPNVPFGNISLIQPMNDSELSQEEGFVANFGARLVTLSGSLLLSYWSTEKATTVSSVKEKTDLMAVVIGGKIGRFIATFELINYQFEELNVIELVRNKGRVITVEGKYRVWRENYLVVNAADASTGVNHAEGKATQLQVGIKSYLYPGVELEVMQVSDSVTEGSVETEATRTQAQLHISF